MQIHPPSALVGDGEFPVHLHHGDGQPFAIINVDPDGTRTRIFMESPADCDRLDRANAKARSLLLGQPVVERQRIVDLNALPESKNAGSDV